MSFEIRNIRKIVLCFVVTISFFWTQVSFAIVISDNAAETEKPKDIPVIFGDWVTPDKDAVIRVANCMDGHGDALCATLVKHAYAELSENDALNPMPDLRDRPLHGVHILKGLRAKKSKIRSNSNSHTKWAGGKLYDPRTGKTYGAKVKLVDKDHIEIAGCIGPGLCKGYIWKRAKNPDLELQQGATILERDEVTDKHVPTSVMRR